MSSNTGTGVIDKRGQTDKLLIGVTLVVTLCAIAWAATDADGFVALMKGAKGFMAANFGWFFILSVFLFIPLLLFLAFGKYKDMRLGHDTDRPEFSTFSWIALLFGCGLGAGYVFWPFGEALWHFHKTPYMAESGTEAAYLVAKGATMLHWGFHQWAIYTLVGLVIAFPAFRQDRPMTVSGALSGILGPNASHTLIGRIVEIIASITALWGAAAANCLGLMLFSVGLKKIFGIDVGLSGQAIIMFSIIIAYTIAAYSGLHKGIKMISDCNVWVSVAWFLFILLAGPTVLLLNGMLETVGQYLNYFFSMALFADPYNTSKGWTQDWPIFYYLWNTSWAPFVGGFIARISKGRTIREYILGVLVIPVCVSFIWFGVLMTATHYIDMNSITNLWEQVQMNPANGSYAVATAFGGGMIVNCLIFLSVAGFLITSADAAAFFIAMQMSHGSLEPKKSQVLLWGLIIGAISIVLLNTNGLDGVKFAGILAGAPFMIVVWAMVYSFFKTLKFEYAIYKENREKEFIAKLKTQILGSAEKETPANTEIPIPAAADSSAQPSNRA